MKPVAFDYRRPSDLAGALAALDGEAKPISGGGSLGPMLNLRLARPAALVDLRALPELRRLSQSADGLTIGSGFTHAEIEDGVVPDVTRGMMRKVASNIAYRPVRNRGTIGGSLVHADPAADWVNCMAVLDATFVLRSKRGERRVSATDFMRGPFVTGIADDEIIEAVFVPLLGERARWSYYKVVRKTGEFAKAIGAIVLDPARNYARVLCGAVEARPIVLAEASRALLAGSRVEAAAMADREVAAALGAHDAAFRRMHRTAVERAFNELPA